MKYRAVVTLFCIVFWLVVIYIIGNIVDYFFLPGINKL